jgi:hypothetical protein
MNMAHSLQVRKSQHTSMAFQEKCPAFMYAIKERNTETYFTMNESWCQNGYNTNVHSHPQNIIIKTY